MQRFNNNNNNNNNISISIRNFKGGESIACNRRYMTDGHDMLSDSLVDYFCIDYGAKSDIQFCK